MLSSAQPQPSTSPMPPRALQVPIQTLSTRPSSTFSSETSVLQRRWWSRLRPLLPRLGEHKSLTNLSTPTYLSKTAQINTHPPPISHMNPWDLPCREYKVDTKRPGGNSTYDVLYTLFRFVLVIHEVNSCGAELVWRHVRSLALLEAVRQIRVRILNANARMYEFVITSTRIYEPLNRESEKYYECECECEPNFSICIGVFHSREEMISRSLRTTSVPDMKT